MRGYLPAYEMIRAKNLKEALRLLNQKKEELRCFAGGTDLMVLMAAGKLLKGKYLDISKIKELKNIKIKPNYIEIGALVTFSEIINHKVIQKEFPNLVQAARETGSIAIQNRGTIGGNIANASPAADTPPALISYNAEIELVSEKQKRTLLYSEYHTGYKTYVMQANEIIRCIRLPRIKKKRIHYYRKIGTRKAQAISKICFSACATFEKNKVIDISIGLGSVGPTPIKSVQLEKYLKNKNLNEISIQDAKNLLYREISPIDDIRSTKDYRLLVAQNVLEQFLCGIG